MPAFDEEAALPPLLASIAALRERSLPDLRVLVVDDGSRDETAQRVRAFAERHPWVELHSHDRNRGLAEGMKSIFRVALRDARPDDVLVTLDADNTHPVDVIPAMLQRISAEGLDVVVASRFQPGAEVHGVPAQRQLYSRVMSLCFRLLLPIPGIWDYSCGYRAYRVALLQRAVQRYGDALITETGFSCMVEILIQLAQLPGARFGEVPLVLRYDLKPTPTKMQVGRTIRDTVRLALRHRFGRTR